MALPSYACYLHAALYALGVTGRSIKQTTGIQNLDQDSYFDELIAIPSLETQAKITAYLDRKTAAIDALIAKKERLIELLDEKRRALITQVVTKGLNPSVPMKDSGVEWFGKIPISWTAMPLKRVLSIPVTDGPHETPEFLDEGVPFLSAESVQQGRLNFESKRGYISRAAHEHYSTKCSPRYEDVFVVKSGATTGKIAIVDTHDEFNVWSPLALVRVNRAQMLPWFAFHLLSAQALQAQVQTRWSYGTQPNISMGAIENLVVTVPPLSEQRVIVEAVRRFGGPEEKAARALSMSVAKLREYRQALVTSAVTGKIDVKAEEAA